MKAAPLIFVYLISACCLTAACATQPDGASAHNSMNALDWSGSYYGLLPCADCEGMETVVKLNNDLTYTSKTRYKGKNGEIFEARGTFRWNEQGNQVILKAADHSTFKIYQVGENMIKQLDKDGNPVAGELADQYNLTKMQPQLVEKYWRLTELFGKAVAFKENQRKEPYMILKSEGNQIIGSGGCNNFHGSYELKEGNRIAFSKIASTMMACIDMETESQFFKVLTMADNYFLGDDVLVLHKAKMAPLARFEAVYLK